METNASPPVQDADQQVKLPEYHPQFCDVSKEADEAVTLVSSDNVKFLVNANILRASSDLFGTTLSLPQPENSSVVIDTLDEDSAAIEGILRIITGKEFPSLSTVKEIAPIALVAENGRCGCYTTTPQNSNLLPRGRWVY
ncbi:hypothetical protein BU17DRAFT_78799 [Hysterangium stoloniferum]|nr:hypothetical protein BU17DRAFT_78799 [Hysterangium stoloniferum]